MNITEARNALDRAIDLAAQSDFTGAMNLADSINEQLSETEDIVFRVRIRLELATFQILAGFPKKALANLNWGMTQAHGPHKESILADRDVQYRLIDGYSRYVDACIYTGLIHVSELEPLIDDAEEICRSFHRPNLEVEIRIARTRIQREKGDLNGAIDAMRETITYGELHELNVTFLYRRLAYLLGDAERYTEVIEILVPLLDNDLGLMDRLGAITDLGHTHLKLGDVDAAVRCAEEVGRMENRVTPNQGAAIWGLQVDVFRAAGRLDDATEAAHKVERAAKTLGHPGLEFNALTDLFDVALDRGDVGEGRELLSRAEILAAQLDHATSRSKYGDKVAERKTRLEEMENE